MRSFDTAVPVEARAICAEFQGRQVLRDVSLSVGRREIFAIIGPSGSGKTTLLRHLLGLARPRQGSAFVFGHPVAELSRHELAGLRRRIGVAFQGGALLNSLSVVQNIELPLKQHTRLDAATIRIMTHIKLELLGLLDIDALMPAQLSGGMLKRASLARAVIMDPELLFVDEPSSGLDPVNAAALDDLLVELRDSLGMTIVVITHAMETALNIADKILLLDSGEVVTVGSPTELLQSRDARVQSMLQRRPVRAGSAADDYLNRLTAGT
ncbi:MAG: ATP-binding cassette domain-containing protein [Gammaproteobacteria bacterium]|nr:ATP-binding cassette domain-containing protein [Gammaproteobacteria bacterium]